MRSCTIAAVLAGSIFFLGSAYSALAVVEISDGSVIGLYHMEDGVDSSGNGYNCTLQGGAVAVAGLLGDAIDFESGSSQYCNDGDTPDQTDFSISLWVKLESSESTQTPICKDDAGQRQFCTYITNTGVIGGDVNGSGAESSSGIADTTWTHLIWMWDDTGQQMAFYIDGALDDTDAIANHPAVSTANLQIGRRGYEAGDRYFDGLIDEVVYKSGSFSGDQIAALYNAGAGDEVCVVVGCGDTGGNGTSTATTTLTAGDALYTYLFFILDALMFVGCVVVIVYCLKYLFNI